MTSTPQGPLGALLVMLACFAFCQVPFRRKADLGYKRRGWQPDSQTLSCQLAWQLALVGNWFETYVCCRQQLDKAELAVGIIR